MSKTTPCKVAVNTQMTPKLTRRGFVIGTAAAGAGLAIGLDIPFGGPTVVRAADGSPEVNVWVVIRPDNTTVIRVARSEMGQGTLTGLAQLVAEELECDWSKVVTEYPTPGQSVARKRAWGDFSTGGSRGIRTSQEYVRKGGATARVMLIQAAANEWKVPASECTAANSVITHTPSGKTTTYGKVVEAAAKLAPPADADVKLKDPKDWKIAGKGVKRLDTRRQDHRRDDLRRRRQAARHAQRHDQGLPGVRRQAEELRRSQGHGHEGRQEGRARQRQHASPSSPIPGGTPRPRSMRCRSSGTKARTPKSPASRSQSGWPKVSTMRSRLTSATRTATPRLRLPAAAKKVEAVYNYPYQNHAPMEPMNATALYTPDKCEVWCGTQNGEAAFAATMEASGLPAEKCEVHKLILGGGFGRRGMTDYVRQAVLIAKQMPGTPVKLLWSREEDMAQGKFHPVTQCKLTGAFDADNNLTALHVRLSGQSILFSVRPAALVNGMDPAAFQGFSPSGDAAIGYSVPNLLVEHSMRNPARSAGLLARRQRQPECDLYGMLHG